VFVLVQEKKYFMLNLQTYCLGEHDICWVGEGAQPVMTYLPLSPETKYQHLQRRAIKSLKSSPMHSTNPTTTATTPQKKTISKNLHTFVPTE
jgi:hypothetical protein